MVKLFIQDSNLVLQKNNGTVRPLITQVDASGLQLTGDKYFNSPYVYDWDVDQQQYLYFPDTSGSYSTRDLFGVQPSDGSGQTLSASDWKVTGKVTGTQPA